MNSLVVVSEEDAFQERETAIDKIFSCMYGVEKGLREMSWRDFRPNTRL